jgi:hypothetical protein
MPYLRKDLLVEIYSAVSTFELILDFLCSLQVLLEIRKAKFVSAFEFPKVAGSLLYRIVGQMDESVFERAQAVFA